MSTPSQRFRTIRHFEVVPAYRGVDCERFAAPPGNFLLQDRPRFRNQFSATHLLQRIVRESGEMLPKILEVNGQAI